jgi:hypothetical protein
MTLRNFTAELPENEKKKGKKMFEKIELIKIGQIKGN